MNKTLLAQLLAAQSQGPVKVTTDITAEQYGATDNSTPILSVVVPFTEGKGLWREERGVTKYCWLTEIVYNVSIFKSRVRETIGHPTIGASIDLYGYDAEVDGQGNPIMVPEIVNGEEVQVLKLITEDELGHPVPPHNLMSFRPNWGTDRTKSFYSRLREKDMLAFVPNKGVPRKDTTIVQQGTETSPQVKSGQESVAWNLLQGLQSFMEKPLLNNALELEALGLTYEEALACPETDLRPAIQMAKFISHIPIAPNAPSQRATTQQAGMGNSLTTMPTTVIGPMEGDAFAKPPESN